MKTRYAVKTLDGWFDAWGEYASKDVRDAFLWNLADALEAMSKWTLGVGPVTLEAVEVNRESPLHPDYDSEKKESSRLTFVQAIKNSLHNGATI